MKIFHKSVRGVSHISNGTPCQDASVAFTVPGFGAIVAVADGLGSCSKSDVGSEIAISVVKSELEQMALAGDGDDALLIAEAFIKVAFAKALNEIRKRAEKDGAPESEYLTTLSVAFFNGRNVAWGHSGDGALIGVTSFGSAKKLTQEQNGDNASIVFPLQSGPSRWVFGHDAQEEYCSVLATTDGLLEVIQPQLLNGTLYERLCGVVAGIGKGGWEEQFAAENVVHLGGHTRCELYNLMAERAKSSAIAAAQCLQDDLSLAVATNEELSVLADLKPEPDWYELIAKQQEGLQRAIAKASGEPCN